MRQKDVSCMVFLKIVHAFQKKKLSRGGFKNITVQIKGWVHGFKK
jgi:hypothetical protein